MLNSYLFPISYAFMAFPVAALICAVPILVLQYRRHGYFNKFRGLLLYLFLLYMMNALFLVLLPLPASRHNAPLSVSSYMQWMPLNFIRDIMAETAVVWSEPSTYVRLFKERAFLQVVFNVFLVVPFGMFMRYYFRVGWSKCLLASFLLSLFFEVTQVTGIYGIYDYPYRLFDVDDLLLNTTGGMIGAVLSEWLLRHVPWMGRRLNPEVDLSQKRVSYTRRAIAFATDWMVLSPLLALMAAMDVWGAYFLVTAVYFMAVPYLTHGKTLGKSLVRIRLVGQGERLRFREIAIRNGLLYWVWGGIHVILGAVTFPGVLQLMYVFGVLLIDAFVFMHVAVRLLNRNKTLLHEEKSGTRHAIT